MKIKYFFKLIFNLQEKQVEEYEQKLSLYETNRGRVFF